jgi:hypothetical protein
MYQQEVVRFCQGAADKEAGSYASNILPKNIEEAIDEIRWHQHNHQAISTSFPSIDPLRPCILAIRGGLRPHELPLCSLKPPYFPEKILVSPLSAILFPFS